MAQKRPIHLTLSENAIQNLKMLAKTDGRSMSDYLDRLLTPKSTAVGSVSQAQAPAALVKPDPVKPNASAPTQRSVMAEITRERLEDGFAPDDNQVARPKGTARR